MFSSPQQHTAALLDCFSSSSLSSPFRLGLLHILSRPHSIEVPFHPFSLTLRSSLFVRILTCVAFPFFCCRQRFIGSLLLSVLHLNASHTSLAASHDEDFCSTLGCNSSTTTLISISFCPSKHSPSLQIHLIPLRLHAQASNWVSQLQVRRCRQVSPNISSPSPT